MVVVSVAIETFSCCVTAMLLKNLRAFAILIRLKSRN